MQKKEKAMNIKQVLEEQTQKARDKQIENPKQKVRMLLAHFLKRSKEYILTHEMEIINKQIEDNLENAVQKLAKGLPIQYITNKQEFMKIEFYVDENVLIPQPDTEILVEEVLTLLENKKQAKVWDLCTGSGCIGIAIAKYKEKVEILATDISSKALQIAKLNAEKNLVHTKMTMREANLFEGIEERNFDVIVSNPPYIKSNVIGSLSKEVQREPKLALDGGEDGIFFYKEIVKQASNYLKQGGYLCLEIGFDQKESVMTLVKEDKHYTEIQAKTDLTELDRIIIAKRV